MSEDGSIRRRSRPARRLGLHVIGPRRRPSRERVRRHASRGGGAQQGPGAAGRRRPALRDSDLARR